MNELLRTSTLLPGIACSDSAAEGSEASSRETGEVQGLVRDASRATVITETGWPSAVLHPKLVLLLHFLFLPGFPQS